MSALKVNSADNLEDLRGQLTQRAALLVALTGSLLMWLTFMLWPFPLLLFGLTVALAGLGLGCRFLAGLHPRPARHLLVWGLTGLALAAVWWLPHPLLPFTVLFVVFVGEMLVRGSGLVAGGLVTGLAFGLNSGGYRYYALPELAGFVAFGLGLAWMVAHTFYTALQWTRSTQQRANRLLEEMRDRQGELQRTMKSLELASDLQRRTHRELILARKEAEEARRLKEQFAANISHELRTPLSLILGFSELMHFSAEVYGEMDWPSTLRRDVYQIYRASRHLLDMIDDILDLSRFEMTGFTLNKEPTPLEPLLQETLDIARDLFRAHPARLEAVFEPGLPALEIDRTRVRQVLLNLFNNARRFTQAGLVRLEARQVGDEILVSLSDTGAGIPADKLPHVFDEFYQVDYSLRRSNTGVGLGLAISKRFIEAHAGHIWVESQEGQGTTFTFSLPVPQHLVLSGHLHGSSLSEPAWPEAKPSVLLLSPDPAAVPLVRRHLEQYEIIWASEAGQVPELAALHHPRAIIKNRAGPGESEAPVSLPVPVIECVLPVQNGLGRELAVAACLTKPITARQLLDTLAPLSGVQEVLIIDDDRGFVQLVERILQATGRPLAIRWAYNGQEGLQAIADRRPDLVLLDLMMPGVDGFEVLERLQAEPELSRVPVILLTATSTQKGAGAGGSGHIAISRPGGLQPLELLGCLQAIIDALKPRYSELAELQVR